MFLFLLLSVSDKCPFCPCKETVFYCSLGVHAAVHVGVFIQKEYKKSALPKCQLVNFIWEQTAVSGKRKIDDLADMNLK